MEKRLKNILILVAVGLVLSTLYEIWMLKKYGDPLTLRLFTYISIPVDIIGWVLLALYFHKKSK